MPQRIDKPGTRVQFVYRCSYFNCEHEDRYYGPVRRHEWYEHEVVLTRDEYGHIYARTKHPE